MLSQPEPWLQLWLAPLLKRHPEIEQVYLLGNQARGPYGQKPNYSLLFYAGYDNALGLLTSLAREEETLRPEDEILHLYVENYGGTFCGIWGGALIPNDLNHNWIEGSDYKLWIEVSGNSRPLSERLRSPQDRRQRERRSEAMISGAQLDTAFKCDDSTAPAAPASGEERRERSDRRRDIWDMVPLCQD